MSRPFLFVLALVFAGNAAATAPAQSFADRVTQGRLAEAGKTGPAYQKALWQKIGNPTTDAYKICVTSNAPAGKTPFTLVADIDAKGKPSHIEVMPPLPVAACMAGQFATWALPPPPAQPKPYPIEIDFSITP